MSKIKKYPSSDQNTLHSYEKRIKEIKERISEPQPTLNASLEHEMIELRDQMEVWKKKCEDLENQMKYMENQHNIALDQKQDSLKFNQARVTELTQENSKLASKVQVLESKSKQSLEDRENWTCEKLALTAKITELLNKQGTIEVHQAHSGQPASCSARQVPTAKRSRRPQEEPDQQKRPRRGEERNQSPADRSAAREAREGKDPRRAREHAGELLIRPRQSLSLQSSRQGD